MSDSSQQNVRILLVESCPDGYQPLAIRRERHAIQRARRESGFRDVIVIDDAPGACFRHLQAALNQESTDIVHFFGHGSPDRALLFEDDHGEVRPIGVDDFARFFGCLTGRVRLVICSACHSRHHAEAVAAHVDHAIGIDGAVDDETACLFATTFYTAVFAGAPVARAFGQACAVCRAEGMASADAFVLASRRPGVEDRPLVSSADGGPDDRPDDGPDDRPDDRHDDGLTLSPPDGARAARRWRAMSGFLRLSGFRAGLVGVVLVTLVAMIAAFWPPLVIVPFEDRAGVVVAAPRLAGGEVRTAVDELVREFERIAPQRVQRVDLALVGVSDEEFVSAARAARAALVVRIEEGPVARILHVPGSRLPDIVTSLPVVRVGDQETRRLLARVLHGLAWSLVQDPGALPRSIDMPVPGSSRLPPQLTVLAIFLGDYMGHREPAWQQDAIRAIQPILRACNGESAERDPGRDSDQWSCSMARYIYHALLCPECPGSSSWLERLRARAPGRLADAATLEIMKRTCSESPVHVRALLAQLNGEWGMGDCRRLALAPPARCLLVENEVQPGWVRILSEPPLGQYKHCGDMPARVLAERASLFGDVGQWHRAAALYWQAMEEAPGSAIYLISWAIAVFMQEPGSPQEPGQRGTVAELEARLVPDRIESQWAITAEFVLWLAGKDRYHAERLCARYAGVAMNDVAVPDLRHLGDRLCGVENDGACRVYRVLRKARIASSEAELCDAMEDVAGSREQVGGGGSVVR